MAGTPTGERREGVLARHLGPDAYWPWAAPVCGLFSLLLAVLALAFTGTPSATESGGDCLDVCFVPSDDAIFAFLQAVALLSAVVAGLVGALALRGETTRVVGVIGLVFAACAAAVIAAAA